MCQLPYLIYGESTTGATMAMFGDARMYGLVGKRDGKPVTQWKRKFDELNFRQGFEGNLWIEKQNGKRKLVGKVKNGQLIINVE